MNNELKSKRNNSGKPDYTNLSATALIPEYSAVNDFLVSVLEMVENNLYQAAMAAMARTFHDVIDQAAKIMKRGETEYGRDNWKIGMTKPSILQSLYRHAYKFSNGEIFDTDSGYKHIGHIYCNLMFLEFHERKGFLPE
jgi:hypothetical protein